MMKILFDMGHPAHVHFFRNAIRELEGRGHAVEVTARDKEVTLSLLKAYGIPHYERGTGNAGTFWKAIGMIATDYKMAKVARKFKPDVTCGILNPYTAQVSRLVGAKSITFTDTEHAKAAQRITFPFTDYIVTPQAYLLDHGKKHTRYNGIHELAYLHPKYFKPDPSVLDELGLSKDEKFAIIRFVSWEASHDAGYKGLNMEEKQALLSEISKHARPVITSERPLPEQFKKYEFKIPPYRMHHAMYYSSLYVGEGATMAHEAALLGTPSVYVSAVSNLLGVPTSLKSKNLLSLFEHGNDVQSSISGYFSDSYKKDFKTRADAYVDSMIDVTGHIVKTIEQSGEDA